MIKGMTGFGSSQISHGRIKGVVEIKSQNHRFLDPVYYLPPGFAAMENRIQQILGKAVERGRISVAIKITEKPQHLIQFNKDMVREYLKYTKILNKEFGLNSALTLADLMKLPGVVEVKEITINPDELWVPMEKGIKQSLSSLLAMRVREGKSLAADFGRVLKDMSAQITKIRARAKRLLSENKKTLSPEEFSSYQKSTDINEELARISHYVAEFKLLLRSAVSVGKKLDFVGQEMQREANTIGSKLQDEVVSNAVIAIKSKIEKLREQAQNVE